MLTYAWQVHARQPGACVPCVLRPLYPLELVVPPAASNNSANKHSTSSTSGSTSGGGGGGGGSSSSSSRSSVLLNRRPVPALAQPAAAGTQFSCFTGTKVQVLTQKARPVEPRELAHAACTGTQFTCFTGTKVQILTQKADSTLALKCLRLLTRCGAFRRGRSWWLLPRSTSHGTCRRRLPQANTLLRLARTRGRQVASLVAP